MESKKELFSSCFQVLGEYYGAWGKVPVCIKDGGGEPAFIIPLLHYHDDAKPLVASDVVNELLQMGEDFVSYHGWYKQELRRFSERQFAIHFGGEHLITFVKQNKFKFTYNNMDFYVWNDSNRRKVKNQLLNILSNKWNEYSKVD